MRALFFYGSLRHLPLLRIVLGRDEGALNSREARLPGARVCAVAEGPFPILIDDPDGTARGVVVDDLTPGDLARLDYYEGGFGYTLVPMVLADGQEVEVYRAPEGCWTPDGDWLLDDWVARWGEMSCYAATEVMSYLGTKTASEVAGSPSPSRSWR